MESGSSLLIQFQTPQEREERQNDDDGEATTLAKEISLDYSDEDVEMLSDTDEHPKRQKRVSSRDNRNDTFAPVDDLDVFAVGDDHVDTSGGEIRRQPAKVQMIFDVEKIGGPPYMKRYMNPRLKGCDELGSFLNSAEQRSRRVERAKRFGLEPTAEESASADEPMLDEPTTGLLEKLYSFYGIDPESVRHKEKYRLNAVHMRGVDGLSTDAIFDYFGPYNPVYLEWIDDNLCNVIWNERKDAARGLLGMSRPIRRIVPQKSKRGRSGSEAAEDNIEETEDAVASSCTKQRSCSDAETKERSKSPPSAGAASSSAAEADDEGDKILDDDVTVDLDVSRVTVPPGQWRVGKKEYSTRAILMRFATVDDVKSRGAQRKSRYYREQGNPNFGGRTGFISQSYIDRMRTTRKRGRADENVAGFSNDLRKSLTDRERWTLLRDDVRRDPELEPGELVEEEDLETGQVKLTYFSSDEDDVEDESETRRKRPRMRMRADEEFERKEHKWRRLQRIKTRGGNVNGGAGVDGDWRSAQQRSRDGGGDLRDRLRRDSKMKITVTNDDHPKRGARDLRERIRPEKKLYDDRYEHDDR